MVCLGNICRSPLAEGILKSKLPDNNFIVESAGTSNYHIGELPDKRSIEVAKKYNIDITNQRGRQFKVSDFDEFDYNLLIKRADTSLFGLIHKCHHFKLPTPQLGVVVMDNELPIMIDLCWPKQKMAVLINMSQAKLLLKQGWNVYSAFDTLTYFDVFQERLREAIQKYG